MNRYGTSIVTPLTSGGLKRRFRVEAAFDGRVGAIATDQIRTADHARLIRRLGVIDPETLDQTLVILREMFTH
jgi:mRNA-degrading endonuclease toxin of MazEF toxin-antitoxin module